MRYTKGHPGQPGNTNARTHGGTGTRTYASWRAMRVRCHNRNTAAWKDYGGRGVTVAPEWDDFAVFLTDMGERPEGKTLDRIDPAGNYGPGNCRWATPLEQRHNWRQHKDTWKDVTR